MSPRIFLTRRWPQPVEDYIAARYEVTFNADDQPLTQEMLRAAAREFDILCPTVSDRLGADLFDQPGCKVRLVCNYGVGFEHIDLAACKRHNIIVTNTPDILTDATAEIAILLMLMAARRAGEGEREIRSGGWNGWRPTHLLGAQTTGRTLGLIGFGRIAQATAAKARGLGMRIIYHSRRRADAAVERALGAAYRVELGDLLSEADFVSLHCPGGAETANLIDARRLAEMRPTAFLINTSRGSVVDEQALASALETGRIAGAGLDVFQNEPHISQCLLNAPNIVLLPHLGSATTDTRIAMGMRAVSNFEHWIAGIPCPDRVA
jgi:lactate dehydrogenase-like 2-hydroxyacid dehydrogenase